MKKNHIFQISLIFIISLFLIHTTEFIERQRELSKLEMKKTQLSIELINLRIRQQQRQFALTKKRSKTKQNN